jgi:hypothetical protein
LQDIRTQADNVLAEFLKEIRSAPHVEFGKMVEILIPFASSLGMHAVVVSNTKMCVM